MKYKVIEGFYDLQDKDEKGNCHLYNRGDIYPREGAQPTEERIGLQKYLREFYEPASPDCTPEDARRMIKKGKELVKR